MPKPIRVILGTFLLVATIGLVTCQSVFYSQTDEQTESTEITNK